MSLTSPFIGHLLWERMVVAEFIRSLGSRVCRGRHSPRLIIILDLFWAVIRTWNGYDQRSVYFMGGLGGAIRGGR